MSRIHHFPETLTKSDLIDPIVNYCQLVPLQLNLIASTTVMAAIAAEMLLDK